MRCAEFGAYPVSHAVAASSAVPVIFSPITLENYAGRCGYQPPAWVAEALRDETLTPQKDDNERDFLNRIGTNFDLSDEQVDRLVAAARKILRESDEFEASLKQAVNGEMGGTYRSTKQGSYRRCAPSRAASLPNASLCTGFGTTRSLCSMRALRSRCFSLRFS